MGEGPEGARRQRNSNRKKHHKALAAQEGDGEGRGGEGEGEWTAWLTVRLCCAFPKARTLRGNSILASQSAVVMKRSC